MRNVTRFLVLLVTVIGCAWMAVGGSNPPITGGDAPRAFGAATMIQERQHTPTYTLTNSYVYGLDLSGSIQGAGTIGGLLSAVLTKNEEPETKNLVFYFFDANGNVSDLVATNGTSLAHYEFDPYGNATASSGSLASANPFRFSTKYTDDETGLLYYGYRYYAPTLGRWVNRDLIEESGGVNIFAYVGGDPVNRVDPTGLWWWDAGLIQDGAGGLLGVYGRENRQECWCGTGRLTAQSIAIFANEMTFRSTEEYVGPEADAARAISRVARTIEIGLLTQGALSSVSTAVAAQGGSVALYGTAAIRTGVTTLAVNSAGQNAGSATEALMEGRTSDALGYLTLATTDAYFATRLMWASRPLPAPTAANAPSQAAERTGVLQGANYAQRRFSSTFSSGGTFAGQTVEEVATALRSGTLSPSEVPIQYIVRDGNTLMLNTRSAQALEQAGIPRAQWNAINMTGDAAAQARLNAQLQRSGLTSQGIPTVTGR